MLVAARRGHVCRFETALLSDQFECSGPDRVSVRVCYHATLLFTAGRPWLKKVLGTGEPLSETDNLAYRKSRSDRERGQTAVLFLLKASSGLIGMAAIYRFPLPNDTEVPAMICVSCGQRAGYNRIVVDSVAGREIGGFCRNCELAESGRVLDRFAKPGRCCSMCDRDGHFLFATLSASVESGDSGLVSSVDYEVTDRTLTLCDEHFHAIENDTPEASGRARQ